MDYWHLFYVVPAAVTLSTGLAYILPFRMEARFNPLFIALCALLALCLPGVIDIALAAAIPVSLAQNYLGVRLQGHDPVRVPWRATVERVQGLRERYGKPEVTEFLTRAYPPPDDPGIIPGMVPGTRSFIPEL